MPVEPGSFQHPYMPNTDADRAEMMVAVGISSIRELFADIPQEFRSPRLRLPSPLSEMELGRALGRLASKNQAIDGGFGGMPSFLGAGVYRHFIPSIVGAMQGRAEFYTAYTPYQPEISQGTLQYTYELQSMLCELTGMQVANAGMYDGATAAAEAALMAVRITGRRTVGILSSVSPNIQEVVQTYCSGSGHGVQVLDNEKPEVNSQTACVITQYPDYHGRVKDLTDLAAATHNAGALMVTSAYPIALGLLTPPSEFGADIVVGEGQSLGNPPNFGGPNYGFFTCREEYLRQMPGRIIGRTTDRLGRTGYVMTLQTREQHIRRERATSNVCTGSALVALGATVYLAALGPRGLRQIAEFCYHKAHYAADRITALPGYNLPLKDKGVFFNEFPVQVPEGLSVEEVNKRLLEAGMIGGLDISNRIPRSMLICVTEMNTREEIDQLVGGLGRIAA